MADLDERSCSCSAKVNLLPFNGATNIIRKYHIAQHFFEDVHTYLYDYPDVRLFSDPLKFFLFVATAY